MDGNHDNECPTHFGINLENPEDEFQANLPPDPMTVDDVAENTIYLETLVSILYNDIYYFLP
jgi:hypothetical protein